MASQFIVMGHESQMPCQRTIREASEAGLTGWCQEQEGRGRGVQQAGKMAMEGWARMKIDMLSYLHPTAILCKLRSVMNIF